MSDLCIMIIIACIMSCLIGIGIGIIVIVEIENALNRANKEKDGDKSHDL